MKGRSGSAHAVRPEAVETSPELVSKPFFWVESSLESTPDRSIIAVVSLSNSGTVPEFLKGTIPEFLQGQSLSRDDVRWAGFHPAVLGRRNADRIRARMG